MIPVSVRLPIVPPSRLTRAALWTMVALIVATAAYLLSRYETLPALLPVHFRPGGTPNGWQYKTPARILMPVFVQLSLLLILGGLSLLLLSRRERGDVATAADARAAITAAEAVALIALIWVAFQGYAATAVVRLWTTEQSTLGRPYLVAELIGLLLTAVAGIRANAHLGRPAPLPYVPDHWKFGQLYCNGRHPALFVPTRDGSRWTLNFGRPAAVFLLAAILTAGIAIPTLILALALRA